MIHDGIKYQNISWFLASFLVVFLMNLDVIRSRGWTAPDPPGDTEMYYSIAQCIASGKGFARDFDDPAWRSTYEAANASGVFTTTLTWHGHGTTAFSPPAVPFLMAGVYALSKGYFFLAWRFVDSLAVSLAAGAATVLARRISGVTAAATTIVLCYLDRFRTQFTPGVRTEGFAILAVMLFVYAAVFMMQKKRIILVAMAGVVTGILILVRSFFVLWLPGLPLLIWACWRWGNRSNQSRAVRIAAFYLAVALATVAPWWVRNCIVLEKFMPLGSQGGYALPGGYSDEVLANRGQWTPSPMARIWESYAGLNDVTGLTQAQLERKRAELGQAAAVRWMKEHWAVLPRLALVRGVTEWRLWQTKRVLLLFGLCLLGSLLHWRRHPQVIVLWFMILADTFTIMATCALSGRYVVPVLFPFYILIGVGTTELLRKTRMLDRYLGRLGRRRNGGLESGNP